jgi:hypothetical protein
MGLHKLPSYAFIGYVGLIALISVTLAPIFDLVPGLCWCILAGSYLIFFISTIEQPVVRCEWAGWILGPSALVVAFGGVPLANVIILIAGILAFSYGIYMGLTENVASLARFNYQHVGYILEIVFIPPRHRHTHSLATDHTTMPLSLKGDSTVSSKDNNINDNNKIVD